MEQTNSFIDEFLAEKPQAHFFSEIALSLRDWISAFREQKDFGDMTHIQGPFATQYQAYLFKSWNDRIGDMLKWEN